MFIYPPTGNRAKKHLERLTICCASPTAARITPVIWSSVATRATSSATGKQTPKFLTARSSLNFSKMPFLCGSRLAFSVAPKFFRLDQIADEFRVRLQLKFFALRLDDARRIFTVDDSAFLTAAARRPVGSARSFFADKISFLNISFFGASLCRLRREFFYPNSFSRIRQSKTLFGNSNFDISKSSGGNNEDERKYFISRFADARLDRSTFSRRDRIFGRLFSGCKRA